MANPIDLDLLADAPDAVKEKVLYERLRQAKNIRVTHKEGRYKVTVGTPPVLKLSMSDHGRDHRMTVAQAMKMLKKQRFTHLQALPGRHGWLLQGKKGTLHHTVWSVSYKVSPKPAASNAAERKEDGVAAVTDVKGTSYAWSSGDFHRKRAKKFGLSEKNGRALEAILGRAGTSARQRADAVRVVIATLTPAERRAAMRYLTERRAMMVFDKDLYDRGVRLPQHHVQGALLHPSKREAIIDKNDMAARARRSGVPDRLVKDSWNHGVKPATKTTSPLREQRAPAAGWLETNRHHNPFTAKNESMTSKTKKTTKPAGKTKKASKKPLPLWDMPGMPEPPPAVQREFERWEKKGAKEVKAKKEKGLWTIYADGEKVQVIPKNKVPKSRSKAEHTMTFSAMFPTKGNAQKSKNKKKASSKTPTKGKGKGAMKATGSPAVSPLKPPYAHLVHALKESKVAGDAKVAQSADALNRQFLALAYQAGEKAHTFALTQVGKIKNAEDLTQYVQVVSMMANQQALSFAGVMAANATSFGLRTCAKILSGRRLSLVANIVHDTGLTSDNLLSEEGYLRDTVLLEFKWDLIGAIYRAARARAFSLVKGALPEALVKRASSLLVQSVDVAAERKGWGTTQSGT